MVYVLLDLFGAYVQRRLGVDLIFELVEGDDGVRVDIVKVRDQQFRGCFVTPGPRILIKEEFQVVFLIGFRRSGTERGCVFWGDVRLSLISRSIGKR